MATDAIMRDMIVSGKTRLLGLIGWPVEHSLSPLLHNYAAQITGQDVVYLALPVRPGEGAMAVEGAMRLGFLGLNITTPHKEIALDALKWLDESARAVQAVNTIRVEDDDVHGYNTDTTGFKSMLDEMGIVGKESRGVDAVILGSGPAARACALALDHLDVHLVTRILTRETRSKTSELQVSFAVATEPDAVDLISNADIVVNATPVGMGEMEGKSPLPPGVELKKGATAIDMVYEPRRSRFLEDAEAAGCRAVNGLPMLCYQAADSFNIWTGEGIRGKMLLEFLAEEGHCA